MAIRGTMTTWLRWEVGTKFYSLKVSDYQWIFGIAKIDQFILIDCYCCDTWLINYLIDSFNYIVKIYKKYLNSLMSTFFGKLLITLSLVFQAYILFENSTAATAFNTKL